MLSGSTTDEPTMRAISAQGAIYVGPRRDDNAPISGWLYLLMNDNWTWDDDKGSLLITVQVYP